MSEREKDATLKASIDAWVQARYEHMSNQFHELRKEVARTRAASEVKRLRSCSDAGRSYIVNSAADKVTQPMPAPPEEKS